MKKYLLIICAVLLVACGKKETTTMDGVKYIPSKNEQSVVYDDLVYVWVDPETKCSYIVARKSGGITPRLSFDGKHICGEK